jgi:hypothetical protein
VCIVLHSHFGFVLALRFNLGLTERAVKHQYAEVTLQRIINRVWILIVKFKRDYEGLRSMVVIVLENFNCNANLEW